MIVYSFSKLEKYLKCSEFYRKHYIDPTTVKVPTDNVATVAGSVVHDVLEMFYGPAINRRIPARDVLESVWLTKLADFPDMIEELDGIRDDIAQLYRRATKGYKGHDAICEEGGKFYTAPTRSTAWRVACERLNLFERQACIDLDARELGKPFNTVSLSQVYAETYRFLAKYSDPIGQAGLTIQALELKFSDVNYKANTVANPCYYPEPLFVPSVISLGEPTLCTGKIDVVATDSQGRIAIIDHKTSKDLPKPFEVMHWEQLLVYAWAHFEVWGDWPDFIGINSVLNNRLVLVPLDPDMAWRAVRRQMQAIQGINAGVFIQQAPGTYGAHCYNKYQNSICEYAHQCHEKFAKQFAVAQTNGGSGRGR